MLACHPKHYGMSPHTFTTTRLDQHRSSLDQHFTIITSRKGGHLFAFLLPAWWWILCCGKRAEQVISLWYWSQVFITLYVYIWARINDGRLKRTNLLAHICYCIWKKRSQLIFKTLLLLLEGSLYGDHQCQNADVALLPKALPTLFSEEFLLPLNLIKLDMLPLGSNNWKLLVLLLQFKAKKS